MAYVLEILIFLTPSIGMIAGLVSSVTIPLFLITLLFNLRDKLDFSIKFYKLEFVFMFWCLLSCLWAENILTSITLYFQIFPIILIGLILKNNLPFPKASEVYAIILGVFIAILLFYIEYFFKGVISNFYRVIFQKNSTYTFFMHSLDRGCALLSITSWICIGLFINRKKYFLCCIFYIFVLCLLSVSDSLASFLGFGIAGIVFILGKLIPTRFFKFARFCLIAGSLLMPVFAYTLEPQQLADKYEDVIPHSAVHRLFIWKFVSEKSLENPFFGAGFGLSKSISMKITKIIEYKEYKWHPLPLHPHNNIMQIILELGIVGLILFLAIVYKYLKSFELIASTNLNLAATSYAFFVNYYIIGMISFSIWQAWWICSLVFTTVMLKYMLQSKKI